MSHLVKFWIFREKQNIKISTHIHTHPHYVILADLKLRDTATSVSSMLEWKVWVTRLTIAGFFFFFWERVSCSTSWCQIHYVAEFSLEPLILLLLPPECWDYKYVPLFLDNFPYYIYIYIKYTYCVCVCHSTHVEVEGLLSKVSFLLLPRGSLRSNSGL